MQWGNVLSRKQSHINQPQQSSSFLCQWKGRPVLPSPGQTVFWALWGHVGGSCLLCAAPVLGSPRCYQELKSPKPVLFFSFFTAVLVEGPSSSTLRFLQPERTQLSETLYCQWDQGSLDAVLSQNQQYWSQPIPCQLHRSASSMPAWGLQGLGGLWHAKKREHESMGWFGSGLQHSQECVQSTESSAGQSWRFNSCTFSAWSGKHEPWVFPTAHLHLWQQKDLWQIRYKAAGRALPIFPVPWAQPVAVAAASLEQSLQPQGTLCSQRTCCGF